MPRLDIGETYGKFLGHADATQHPPQLSVVETWGINACVLKFIAQLFDRIRLVIIDVRIEMKHTALYDLSVIVDIDYQRHIQFDYQAILAGFGVVDLWFRNGQLAGRNYLFRQVK